MNLATEIEEIPEEDNTEEEFTLSSSFSKWGPIIAVLSLIGITYGVQRTALALYAEQLSPGEIFPLGENFPNFLVFISVASTIIAYGLFKGISGFFSSSISVRFSRKKTLITGLSLLLVGSITLAFGKYLWALILGNMFIGGGLGFFFTSSMSALTDIAGTKSSAFSVGSMEFSVYFGSSFGSFLAGFIAGKSEQSFAGSFIFALAVAGVALIVGIFLLRKVETVDLVKGTKQEILLDSTKVETRWSFRNIFKTPTLVLSYIGGHFSRIMDSIIVLLLPILLATTYGFSAFQIGAVASVFTLSWAVAMPITGRISDRFGRKIPVVTGLIVEGASFILMIYAESFTMVILLALTAGLGTATYYPVLPSITKDVVPIIKKEKSLGIYRMLLDTGYFTGPLISIGLVYAAFNINFLDETPQANMLKFPFLVIGICLALIGLGFAFLAIETRPGWVQASYSMKHANKVLEVYNKLNEAFKDYLEDDDIECCTQSMKEAKELEREADVLVMKVTQALYGNVRPAPDDYHFYKITDILDSSIGHSLKSLRKLILLPREKLSSMFIEYLKLESDLLTDLIKSAAGALEVVCIQPLASHPIFDEVHKLEHALDKNNQKALKEIVTDKDSKLSSVQSLFVFQIIESLEIASNLIEDAVDVMKIVGLKHQVSPLII